MELKKELVQSTFSQLKAAPKSGEMVLRAAEQRQRPKRYVWRRVVITAVILALAMSLTIGVNAATNGELFQQVTTLIKSQSGVDVIEIIDENGEKSCLAFSYSILDQEGSSGSQEQICFLFNGEEGLEFRDFREFLEEKLEESGPES